MWNTIIVEPLTNLLLWIYDLLGHGPNAFGFAIILFTIIIKLLTWPLNASQVKSSQAMQEFQNDKEWQDIQKKYAKDREKLAQEQMRLYKERGINPFASCLPSLIQLPILFALFPLLNRVLASTPLSLLQLERMIYPFQNIKNIIPLNSHFLWMDLGRPEAFPLPFGLEIPFLPLGFPVLAVIVMFTTYVQSKLTMPVSTNPNDQSAMVSKQMTIMMPIMLGMMALSLASGVAVYLLISNLIGIVQYAATGRANWRSLLPGGDKDTKKQPISKKK